jgi:hypothetical protein
MRIRFFARVVGTFSGPHSPRIGCTRGGVAPCRLRLLKIFGTRPG